MRTPRWSSLDLTQGSASGHPQSALTENKIPNLCTQCYKMFAICVGSTRGSHSIVANFPEKVYQIAARDNHLPILSLACFTSSQITSLW